MKYLTINETAEKLVEKDVTEEAVVKKTLRFLIEKKANITNRKLNI